MAETWLAKLKALEAHVAVLQETRAHVDTWRKVRKELEQIVPRPKGDLKSPPSVAEVLDQVETTSTADQTALWDEIRAEIEALRLKIRAEMEANSLVNSRGPKSDLAGKNDPSFRSDLADRHRGNAGQRARDGKRAGAGGRLSNPAQSEKGRGRANPDSIHEEGAGVLGIHAGNAGPLGAG